MQEMYNQFIDKFIDGFYFDLTKGSLEINRTKDNSG